jgi:uncharacterized membrane protein (UPF0127 family)
VVRIENAATGRLVAGNVRVASTCLARTIGLLGERSLPSEQGLLLIPCASVHTFGMQFAIDILFLDRQNRVLRVFPSVGPCRVRIGPRGTRSALELSAGATSDAGVAVGDCLAVIPAESGLESKREGAAT